MLYRRVRRSALAAATAVLAAALLPRAGGAEQKHRLELGTDDPDHTMAVTGRLLDADGEPVADGRIALVAEVWCRTERPIGSYHHGGLPLSRRVTRPFRTDDAGRFRAEAPVGPARPAWDVCAFGLAEGHGLARIKLDASAPTQDVTLRLEREHVVRGRLIDTQGQPVAGASVRPILVSSMGTTRETLVPLGQIPPYAFPFVPEATTDDKGRFLIRGLGKEKVWLECNHERIAPQRVNAETSPRDKALDAGFSMVAPRIVEGRVTQGDTGRPAAGCRIVVQTRFNNISEGQTDEDGRYAVKLYPGDPAWLTVFPPEGEPYFVWKKGLSFAQAVRREHDVALERGILVRGRITEEPTGRVVPEALVLYRPRRVNNPYNTKVGSDYYLDWYRTAVTAAVSRADGTFTIAAPPGPGHLFVLGPTLDYIHVETSVGALEYGRPSLIRNYPDALVPLDLKPGDSPRDVAVTLRRGVTLRARVETPDGMPAAPFVAMSRSYLKTGFLNWQESWNVLEVRDGCLRLPGCDPDRGGTVWLFDRKHSLGLTHTFSGAEASGPPLTLRLQPCGSATVRIVDQQGKPAKSGGVHLYVSFAPGTIMAVTFYSGRDDHDLEGDWGLWANYSYKPDPKRGADGRTTFTDLVPGLTYSLATFDGVDPLKGEPKLEFRVEPGEARVLSDFVIGK